MDNNNWFGRHIFDESHREGLERQAAMNEYVHGMARDQAEEAAHADYRKAHHAEAAAHHLHGMNIGRAIGGEEGAKISSQHAAHYQLHLKALGFNPNDAVPPEVQAHMAKLQAKDARRHKFSAHGADQFIVAK